MLWSIIYNFVIILNLYIKKKLGWKIFQKILLIVRKKGGRKVKKNRFKYQLHIFDGPSKINQEFFFKCPDTLVWISSKKTWYLHPRMLHSYLALVPKHTP